MKIEAGKFYRTRDGRKVGPVDVDGTDYWCVSARLGGIENSWRLNGLWHASLPAHKLDLIAEWKDDGPVREVTRKEIVPGRYGKLQLGVGVNSPKVYLDFAEGNMFDAADLRSLIATLTEIADALDATGGKE